MANGYGDLDVTGSGAGSGDMLKSTYDSDDDGRVEGADQVTDGTNTVSAAQARSHLDSTSNPHSTTAAQVGALDSATTQAHIDNTSNPHSTTAAQVGAAATSHTHELTDLDSGAAQDRAVLYADGSGGVTAEPERRRTLTTVNPAGSTRTLTVAPGSVEVLVTNGNLAISTPTYSEGVERIEYGVLYTLATHSVTLDGIELTNRVGNHPTLSDDMLVKYVTENLGNRWVTHVEYSSVLGTTPAELEDMIVMHEGIMRDPSTIPSVIAAGGVTYEGLYALVPELFDDHSSSGYSYGPIASHPQESNLTGANTVFGPGNAADIQAVINAAAADAYIGIDGTFTGANDDSITPQAGQTLVGVGTTAILDNIRIEPNASAVYNLTVKNTVQSGTLGDSSHACIYMAAGSTVNHCTANNGDGTGIKVPPNGIVEYNIITRNGRYGMTGYGAVGNADNATVRYNKVTLNNSAGYPDTVDASATKFASGSEGMALRHNWFDDNRGSGIWLDGQSDACVVEWNLCENNDEAGIFIELQEIITAVTECRYNSVRNNKYGLKYSDADCYGHDNFAYYNETSLYLVSSSRPSFTLSDVREHDSIFYQDPATTKTSVRGWSVALREEDGGSGTGLPAAVDLDGIEHHLTTGSDEADWYYRRLDGASAVTYTPAEWDALGYETNPDRIYDQ